MTRLIENVASFTKFLHKGKIYYTSDPMKPLVESNLATQVGDGLFVLSGSLTKILDKIEGAIMEIAKKVGAEPVWVPYILSLQNTKKSQYIKSFSDQALMIRPYQHNASGNLPQKKWMGMASPTVCYHYMSSLTGKNLKGNRTATARASCARKEKGKLRDLSRLTNFTMREIISFGDQEYCSRQQEKIMKETEKTLNSIFDLTYEVVVASDPFFGKKSALKKKAQLISESKYEIQAAIPFNKSSISIGSSNQHGRVFYDRFRITAKDNKLASSSCTGFGYERMLYAIVAQKGTNFSSPYYKKLLNA